MSLYIVPTPIGNLSDITLRALEVLQEVSAIACEDTTHTRKLLNHYEIKKRLIHYDDSRGEEGLKEVLNLLRKGESVALVSDAGMPFISDPGHLLIKASEEEGFKLEVLPGPSAFINAWVHAGMGGPFSFFGFLPRKKGELLARLSELKSHKEALIFYEAPHRLQKTLEAIEGVFGERKLVIARELTKKFEEVIRTTTTQSLEWLKNGTIKGEFVLVVEGAKEEKLQEKSIEEELQEYMDMGMSKKDAVKIVSQERNLPKREVYQVSLDL